MRSFLFNFTKGAEESNAENLLVIHSADLAAKYEKSYQSHRQHSVEVEQKKASQVSRRSSSEISRTSSPLPWEGLRWGGFFWGKVASGQTLWGAGISLASLK